MREKREFNLPKGPTKDASEIILEPIRSKESMYKELKADIYDLDSRITIQSHDVAHELHRMKGEITAIKITTVVIIALMAIMTIVFGGIPC